MNLRWLWFDFVPPSLGLSRKERRKVMRRAMDLPGATATLLVVILLPILVVMIPGLIAMTVWLAQGGPYRTMTIGISSLMLVAVLGAVLHGYLLQYAFFSYVHKALAGLGMPICPHCEYRLNGLGPDDAVCPECGTTFRPAKCPKCNYPIDELGGLVVSCPFCGTDLVRPDSLLNQLYEVYVSRAAQFRFRSTTKPIALDEAAAAFIARATYGRLRIRRVILVISFAAVTAIPVLLLGVTIVEAWTLNKFQWLFLETLLTLVAYSIVVYVLFRYLHTRPRRRALRAAGHDICMSCGHVFDDDENAAGTLNCPECLARRKPLEHGVTRSIRKTRAEPTG